MHSQHLTCILFSLLSVNPGTPGCSVDYHFCTIEGPGVSSASVESVRLLGVGVRSEDFVNPLCVERHVDEDARLVLSGAAPAMDAHAHNDLDVAVLTHQGAAVIPLQGGKSEKKRSLLGFSAGNENHQLEAAAADETQRNAAANVKVSRQRGGHSGRTEPRRGSSDPFPLQAENNHRAVCQACSTLPRRNTSAESLLRPTG